MTYSEPGIFSCDECPEGVDTRKPEFREAFIEAKRLGWRSFRGPDNEWAHACPDCVSEYNSKHVKQR